jgi:PQQ-like domain
VIAPLLAALSLAAAAPPNVDWTRFGYTASRTSSGPATTGITAGNVARLRRQVVQLDGTVDASPIYLHSVQVGGSTHDVFFVTTTYGRTEAVDASSGAVLWRFTPSGYSSWAGTYRITNSTPVADPSRRFLYSASPDGRIHKLAVDDGREAWSTAITLLPEREKIASPLNFWKGRVIATTGGYIGDAPPYQGHVAILDAASGKLLHVWNSLCSDRTGLIDPKSCAASDSAIWSRAGAAIDPATGNLLVATGNAPWDGRTNWGDSALLLSPNGKLLQNWTPTNEAELNSGDVDLGSTSPALLGSGYLAQGGKDGKIRLLRLARMNGIAHAGARKGGELQTVSTPSGTDLFTALAVWRSHGRTWMFAADGGGTAAWVLRGGRLRQVWRNQTAGTSPVVAGGLLYVYDPAGSLRVYAPGSGRQLASPAAGSGHWNSPIVVAGRIALPEGDANDHRTSGALDIWRLP